MARMKTTIFDFSGMYPRDLSCDVSLSLGEMEGTNLYCSEEAEAGIRFLIREAGVEGIHLIDHGNYHYVSKLYLDEIREETALIVLDHHTDLQAPGLFDLLSCGNWIRAVIGKNPYVKRICLLGPSKHAFAELEEEMAAKVDYLSEEELSKVDLKAWLQERCEGKKVWLSVDLDLLSKSVFETNWDQGEMSLGEMKGILRTVQALPGLTGIDLCGGDPEHFTEESRAVYEDLLAFLQSFDTIEEQM